MDIRFLLMLIAFCGALAETKKVKAAKAMVKELSMTLYVSPYEVSLVNTRKAEQVLTNLLLSVNPAKNDDDFRYYQVLAVQAEVAIEFAKRSQFGNDTELYLTTVDRVLQEALAKPLEVVPRLKKLMANVFNVTVPARDFVDVVCQMYKECNYLISLLVQKYEVSQNLEQPLRLLLKAGKSSELYLSQHPLIVAAAKNNVVIEFLYTNVANFVELALNMSEILQELM